MTFQNVKLSSLRKYKEMKITQPELTDDSNMKLLKQSEQLNKVELSEPTKKQLNPPIMKPLKLMSMEDPLKSFLHPSVMQQLPRTPKQLPFIPLELPGGSDPLAPPVDDLNIPLVPPIPGELNFDPELAIPVDTPPPLPLIEAEPQLVDPQLFDQIRATPEAPFQSDLVPT